MKIWYKYLATNFHITVREDEMSVHGPNPYFEPPPGTIQGFLQRQAEQELWFQGYTQNERERLARQRGGEQAEADRLEAERMYEIEQSDREAWRASLDAPDDDNSDPDVLDEENDSDWETGLEEDDPGDPLAEYGIDDDYLSSLEGDDASNVRVYEIAREFRVPSAHVLAKLWELGEFVQSASSILVEPVVQKLRLAFIHDDWNRYENATRLRVDWESDAAYAEVQDLLPTTLVNSPCGEA